MPTVRDLYARLVPRRLRTSGAAHRARHALRATRERAGLPATALDPAYRDFNHLIHHLRTAELRRMPRGEILLSAGCSDRWYFDWIEEAYGPVKRHIGVERYLPRPDNLPPYVEWVENTVAEMSGVGDRSVDVVFSGQNLEHLWPDEVAGFACEAARVLRPGGHLVVDTPNRRVTAELLWAQPEHTVEWTPEEAVTLVELAGFDVTALRGIWSTLEPRARSPWPRYPDDPLATASVFERIQLGPTDPTGSFVFWLEAVRTERRPDIAGVRALCDEVFATAWPERVARRYVQRGVQQVEDGRIWVHVPPHTKGMIVHGPFLPVPPGRFTAIFGLRRSGEADGDVARLDVISGGTTLAEKVVDGASLGAGATPIEVPFACSETTFGVEMRAHSCRRGGFDVAVDVALRDDDGVIARRAATRPLA